MSFDPDAPAGESGKYQVMPPLAPDDFEALVADIDVNGVLVPVDYDEHGNILDGHHRVEACRQLGITEWPRKVREGLTEIEKRSHTRSLNLARRHLTAKQKRELIAAQLVDTPDQSDRSIADGLGVSHHTVAGVRDGLMATGQIAQLDKTVGKDGKARPAGKPKTTENYDTAAEGRTANPAPAFSQMSRAQRRAEKSVEWFEERFYVLMVVCECTGPFELPPYLGAERVKEVARQIEVARKNLAAFKRRIEETHP
jgi:ParB-like chromosome segregation protein Spo0J